MSWFVSSQEIYDDVFVCVCVHTMVQTKLFTIADGGKAKKNKLVSELKTMHTLWDFQRFFFHPRSSGFINHVQKHATLKRSSN